MEASMDSETVRERLEELAEELQTVASLVHTSIKSQQHEGLDEAAGAFDCSGDAERKFQASGVVWRSTHLTTPRKVLTEVVPRVACLG